MLSLCKAPSDASTKLGRRCFIKLLAFSGVGLFLPRRSLAYLADHPTSDRFLSFFNTVTKESLDVVYWSKGKYVRDALADIDFLMRDQRLGEVKPIDTSLLNLLYSIRLKLNCSQPFHVISGYRSPQTNRMLRKKGAGAAKNSFHMYGKAVDIRMPECRTSVLRRTAMNLKSGGVGYYPRSNFVHLDVGPVRYWSRPRPKKRKK